MPTSSRRSVSAATRRASRSSPVVLASRRHSSRVRTWPSWESRTDSSARRTVGDVDEAMSHQSREGKFSRFVSTFGRLSFAPFGAVVSLWPNPGLAPRAAFLRRCAGVFPAGVRAALLRPHPCSRPGCITVIRFFGVGKGSPCPCHFVSQRNRSCDAERSRSRTLPGPGR